MTAHHDTFWASADDNASGLAALLAVARHLRNTFDLGATTVSVLELSSGVLPEAPLRSSTLGVGLAGISHALP